MFYMFIVGFFLLFVISVLSYILYWKNRHCEVLKNEVFTYSTDLNTLHNDMSRILRDYNALKREHKDLKDKCANFELVKAYIDGDCPNDDFTYDIRTLKMAIDRVITKFEEVNHTRIGEVWVTKDSFDKNQITIKL